MGPLQTEFNHVGILTVFRGENDSIVGEFYAQDFLDLNSTD